MQINLDLIVESIRAYPGLTRKAPIAEVFRELVLQTGSGQALPNYGDDAAVIPHGDHYLLLATDGIMTGLLLNEPYAAGKAAVMVTVNDIYSMGGRPLALVNVLASGDDEQRAQIVAGLKKGCAKLGVAMVGGHLHPDAPADHPHLSVAILGQAKALLRSHLAAPGDDLILVSDLDGRPGCASVKSWDANSGKTTEQLLARLEVMPAIAEAGLAKAAKDISNAGILGTLAIMVENSGAGALIHLDHLPRPQGLDVMTWLLSFQSYGFALSAPPKNSASILALFRERGLAAEVVGSVTEKRLVEVAEGGQRRTLFNLAHEPITGISPVPGPVPGLP